LAALKIHCLFVRILLVNSGVAPPESEYHTNPCLYLLYCIQIGLLRKLAMNRSDLDRLFRQLSSIKHLKMQEDRGLQDLGHANSIFMLEKYSERYYLLPSPMFSDASVHVPDLYDGIYMYAILSDYPQLVMVGAPYSHDEIARE